MQWENKSESEKAEAISYHQLREHVIQLVISGHRQRGLHALQGKVIPQLVGDLRVIVAVKAAEDEGEATPAAAARALPRSHGCRACSANQVGRMGGSLWTSLWPPPPYSSASVRAHCAHRERAEWGLNQDGLPLVSSLNISISKVFLKIDSFKINHNAEVNAKGG